MKIGDTVKIKLNNGQTYLAKIETIEAVGIEGEYYATDERFRRGAFYFTQIEYIKSCKRNGDLYVIPEDAPYNKAGEIISELIKKLKDGKTKPKPPEVDNDKWKGRLN